MRNVTLATSNGLVYSWGQNLLPAPHHKRTRLHHIATAAAAAAKANFSNHGYVVCIVCAWYGGYACSMCVVCNGCVYEE